jgi:hypothetical protein
LVDVSEILPCFLGWQVVMLCSLVVMLCCWCDSKVWKAERRWAR